MQESKSQYDPEQYVPGKVAGKIVGTSAEVLANMRFFGKGPAYSKIGSTIRYKVADLHDYMEKSRVVPRGD